MHQDKRISFKDFSVAAFTDLSLGWVVLRHTLPYSVSLQPKTLKRSTYKFLSTQHEDRKKITFKKQHAF